MRAELLPCKPVGDRHVLEEKVEAYLLRRVREAGGRTIKLQRVRGWPDRIVLLRGVWWVECKRPKGGRYEPLQQRVGAWLTRHGYNYSLVNTRAQVDAWLAKALK